MYYLLNFPNAPCGPSNLPFIERNKQSHPATVKNYRKNVEEMLEGYKFPEI